MVKLVLSLHLLLVENRILQNDANVLVNTILTHKPQIFLVTNLFQKKFTKHYILIRLYFNLIIFNNYILMSLAQEKQNLHSFLQFALRCFDFNLFLGTNIKLIAIVRFYPKWSMWKWEKKQLYHQPMNQIDYETNVESKSTFASE